ncbi:death ligand signal enhancer isoform X2 [Hyla sarda]|uniref:death ligand signal enhancer isoform X2 n=1 Tax=Hyla sarda TaxID=327740 RepID=UPI0024C3E3ED|nr:death ligand signal enhancer isoform X2 [Hyla sarda]
MAFLELRRQRNSWGYTVCLTPIKGNRSCSNCVTSPLWRLWYLLIWRCSYSSKSSGEHGGQNGQEQKKKGNFQFCAGQLPQYTMLDAFGVGAAAVFFLHLARQISFHCHINKSREDQAPQCASLKQIFTSLSDYNNLSVKSHIVPQAVQPCTWNELCLQAEANLQDADSSLEISSTASSSGPLHHVPERGESQTEDFLDLSSSCELETREATTSAYAEEPLELKEEVKESLQGAASRLLDVTESTVPTVLNIFGIISARDSGDYRTAFRFFRESAEAGYSKAQYNTAVLYEKGKGVAKDMAKAAELYHLAAEGGHQQAKYRYARYLLNAKPEDTQSAVTMLQEAAQAGVKEAQAYLGVFYSKESHFNPTKAARYFWMAAENGDVQSRYHLGVCYERGFGVPASRHEALRHFERAAKSGHGESQHKLIELQSHVTGGLGSPPASSLRTTTSSPCLPVLERVKIRMETNSNFSARSTSSLGLPHSLSTGNLIMSPAECGSYLLAPVHVTGLAPPMSALRAIGVG